MLKNFTPVPEDICIVTVCDNHFAIMLSVLIKSIEINHVANETIHIFVVEDHIDTKNKLKLIDSIDKGNIEITWLPIKDVIPKNVAFPLDASTFPLNVYVRLFIPHFVPKTYSKAIYLDVDMVVKKDISLLWNTEINGNLIAGVVDRSEKVSSTWGGITNYQELGLSPETKYFNSGLLIMDLEKWRETELSLEILACITKHKQFANFPDQYGLNVIFANQWFELDPRWNNYATLNEENPYIIHFIGRKPIYSSYENNVNYKNEFHYYLKLTQWADFKQKKEYDRLFFKLLHRSEKIIKNLFRKV